MRKRSVLVLQSTGNICFIGYLNLTFFIHRSENFGMVTGIVDSYQCKILPPLSTSRSEEARGYNNRQQQSTRSDGSSRNSTAQSLHTNSSNSTTSHYNSSSRQDQQQQGQMYHGKNDDNNVNYRQTHRKR